jgi:hypothetical protein
MNNPREGSAETPGLAGDLGEHVCWEVEGLLDLLVAVLSRGHDPQGYHGVARQATERADPG